MDHVNQDNIDAFYTRARVFNDATMVLKDNIWSMNDAIWTYYRYRDTIDSSSIAAVNDAIKALDTATETLESIVASMCALRSDKRTVVKSHRS